MKTNKIISTITIILVVVLISLVAFGGVYTKKLNRMQNVVKDYQYNMDLEGRRVISLKPSDNVETKIKDSEGKEVTEDLTDEEIAEKGYTKEEKKDNEESGLTVENYEKSKAIIEKRLKDLEVYNYTIKLDRETGIIYLEMPEDSKVDHTISNISEGGKFEIQDSETEEVLLNNSNLKDVRVLYNTDTKGTTVYLSMEFNKEGREKLAEISKTYVKSETPVEDTNSTSEENQAEDSESNETETKTTEKKVSLKIDDSEMITTSFDETIENGTIQLSMGAATTDTDTIKDTDEKAKTIATLLDNGNLPVVYELNENEYVGTDLTRDVMQKVIIAIVAAMIVALVLLIIKYKFKGLLVAISAIGFVGLCTLIIRYTNVIVTLNSLVSMFIVILLNYAFNIIILEKLKSKADINTATKETYKEFFTKVVPVVIISIAFSFIKWIPISSFGMTLLWGIVAIALYNIVITRNLLK